MKCVSLKHFDAIFQTIFKPSGEGEDKILKIVLIILVVSGYDIRSTRLMREFLERMKSSLVFDFGSNQRNKFFTKKFDTQASSNLKFDVSDSVKMNNFNPKQVFKKMENSFRIVKKNQRGICKKIL